MTYRMVFDSGSKVLKCVIADASGRIFNTETLYPEVIRTEDGFGRSLNHKTLWNDILALAQRTITNAKIDAKQIRFISACSIRPSTVFTDANNNPIYISTSFDVRGIDKGEEIEQKFESLTGRSLYSATGHNPSILFSPARYATFLENLQDAESSQKIEQYLPVDSWILMKFGGEPHVNYVSAAESGFFDLQTKWWADAWEQIFDLPEFFLPLIVKSGEIIGTVSEETQRELGLSSETALVAGISDTQAALLGTNCVVPGSITAVLGSTTPVQGVSENLYIDEQQRTWSSLLSIKNICDHYIVEANTGITGQIVKWAANLFVSDPTMELQERYQQLDKSFMEFDAIEQKWTPTELINQAVYAFLGPSRLANNNSGLAPGQFVFTPPGGVEESTLSQTALVGAIFDNIQFAVMQNFEVLREILQTPQFNYAITGGIARNPTLCQRFSDTLSTPIRIAEDPESTVRGLLLLCDIAEGTIKSKEDLTQRIQDQQILRTLTPRVEMGEKMRTKFTNWEKFQKKYAI